MENATKFIYAGNIFTQSGTKTQRLKLVSRIHTLEK